MSTFQELGAPFSLFEAPIDDCAGYSGPGVCSICETPQPHTFLLGTGCCIIVHCSSCNVENGLSTSRKKSQTCRSCGAVIGFPPALSQLEEILCCYSCLRSGLVAITKDSELGMISWGQAFEGITHGVPGLKNPNFELVELKDGWIGAILPSEIMFELLRTPDYITWQGDQWLFCCKHPMTFMGFKTAQQLLALDKQYTEETLFQKVTQGRFTFSHGAIDGFSFYLFKCKTCGTNRFHWDMD
ncbi:CbrC family protein [Solilutibacter silvestris]|uniref:CbrC family protein n=1 Tax=Solilutibacter silvestris TaxID=1645665 RepID=UPI003D327812